MLNYSATELLFHYLVQRTEDMYDMTTKVLIPDTIIYKYLSKFHILLGVHSLTSGTLRQHKV